MKLVELCEEFYFKGREIAEQQTERRQYDNQDK